MPNICSNCLGDGSLIEDTRIGTLKGPPQDSPAVALNVQHAIRIKKRRQLCLRDLFHYDGNLIGLSVDLGGNAGFPGLPRVHKAVYGAADPAASSLSSLDGAVLYLPLRHVTTQPPSFLGWHPHCTPEQILRRWRRSRTHILPLPLPRQR